jgi:hypothetical protein
MSAPFIENYRFRYKTRGKWIYIPNEACRRRAAQILRFFERAIEFPAYFYHYKSGGHVAALHGHLSGQHFFKIDIRNFFYSIANNRVARTLASYGLRGAPKYAKWSTVRNPYGPHPRYVLPIGFWQSPHIASLVMVKSPIADAIERAIDRGVSVTVYLDDIIGSSVDADLLREVYDDIRLACATAGLIPNPDKLTPPSAAIVAFNCDLTSGRAEVTDERIAKFYRAFPSFRARESFETYVTRVASENRR